MRTDRRAFLRFALGALALLRWRPAWAATRETAESVHQATCNTRLGALGVRLPRLTGPPPAAKPYAGAARTPLAAGAEVAGPPLAEVVVRGSAAGGAEGTDLTLTLLGSLLHLTNGRTGRTPQTARLRAAPSAGALYSGEVYVVAERVSGLPPAVYYYDVARHALAEVRPGRAADEVRGALEDPPGAAAWVLLTNVFGRYTWRYANRGYRYALIDSGHIGENLALAARSEGLTELRFARFHDDALNALLGLDGRDEAVCAVHAVAPVALARPSLPSSGVRLVEAGSLGDGAGGELPTATQRYHAATKLVPGASSPAPRGRPSEAPAASVPSVLLPAAGEPPSASVAHTIGERRSPRRFRVKTMAFGDLGFVLGMAQPPSGRPLGPDVVLYVAAHRVAGLTPGIYHYEPVASVLQRLRGGDQSEALARICLGQENAALASAGILMLGRLARAAARDGERSYRDLLVESGAIGQRVYLAAEALGLAARNLAAFRDDPLNRLLRLDGRSEAVLHLTMLGHPAGIDSSTE